MSDHRQSRAPSRFAAIRSGTGRRIFLGLAVFTLIRAAEAMAADQAANPAVGTTREADRAPAPISAAPFAPQSFSGRLTESIPDPEFTAMRGGRDGLPAGLLLTVPREYSLPPAAEPRSFSNEFRPRGHSVFETNPSLANANDNLMVDKTVWQRLQEYRNHDRVRVLTLWESGASAVSIQTNRKGDPSLQWTSRLMNRGGATRGLLDRWMPSSMFRGFSHSTASPSGKPANAPAAPHSGMSAIP
jgi:hypothetical protein